MKATLIFDLPEDQMEHKRAVKSTDAFLALWEIANEVFRPARKHGYGNGKNSERLNQLLQNEQVAEAIGLLEEEFYEIVNEKEVNPSENLE